ncbi:hypothetical protein BSK59_13060 [Paenibacillus odorifer]|uniref:tyrosine-type recombinase/integrase n=1 Tax=Paenibacillus odorifer TaxID=189426 RepID=UPI00096F4C3E|nr:site-specific integrase [Paenibacillus odorifer]OME55402.1 hypothetical protein BSK59_13060 [Paenibacillus odorifer]
MSTASNNLYYLPSSKSLIEKHIESFFEGFNGKSTGEEYKRDIILYFSEIKEKEIKHLTIEDLRISLTDMINFKKYLESCTKTNGIDKKYKNGSINRAISAVKSLYEHLAAHDEYKDMINLAMFKKVKRLKKDTKHIDVIYEEEAKLIANLALQELHNPLEKNALICLAIETSIRKDAVTKIRYSDISKHRTRNDLMVISSEVIFDKTKMVEHKEITIGLYNKLINIKGDKKDSDFIFSMSSSGIDLMTKRLCEKAGLDMTRKYSFHSLKKTGVQFVYDTKGLRAAQVQAGHSSPATTSESYIEKETNMATEMFMEVDNSTFDELTREEMLSMLKSLTGSVAINLRNEAEEILKQRR